MMLEEITRHMNRFYDIDTNPQEISDVIDRITDTEKSLLSSFYSGYTGNTVRSIYKYLDFSDVCPLGWFLKSKIIEYRNSTDYANAKLYKVEMYVNDTHPDDHGDEIMGVLEYALERSCIDGVYLHKVKTEVVDFYFHEDHVLNFYCDLKDVIDTFEKNKKKERMIKNDE